MPAGVQLARRIEGTECDAAMKEFRAAADLLGNRQVAWQQVADGFAFAIGQQMPFSSTLGLGLRGPVTDEELKRLESFYFDRGEEARVLVNPC